MIKIFVLGKELDLFDDEGVQLNRSIKNLSDISAVFSTFSQQFTVPASRRNNQIFQHYYRDDINTDISALKRLDAYITLNGQLFESGGVQLEGASIENGIPKDYKLGFYGNNSRLREFVGDETLKALDLTAYNHTYDATTILGGFGSNSVGGSVDNINGGDVIYPLFSPVANWFYDSSGGAGAQVPNNIAFNAVGQGHGVDYYEVKPALIVTKILEAIEDKYGVTFTGSFLSTSPFNQLFMWLHNREGWTFEGQDEVTFQSITPKVPAFFNHTQTGTAIIADSVGDTMSFTTGTYGFSSLSFEFTITIVSASEDYFLSMWVNGAQFSVQKVTSASSTYTFSTLFIPSGSNTTIEFKIARTTTSLLTEIEYECLSFPHAPVFGGNLEVRGKQTKADSFAADIIMNNLIPDIKITDFLNGLIKMYNLVVTSDDGQTFNVETYNDFYASGNEIDLSRWLDTSEVEVNEIPRYGSLEFKFNESDQVLQKNFRQGNGRGYGDLIARFNFDSPEVFTVDVPFDLPFTQYLTDQGEGATGQTEFTVYPSITLDEDGAASSYYGAPVLFYRGEDLDISATPISFVDELGDETEINLIPFCETVTTQTSAASDGMTFSQETNPFLRTEAAANLYGEYWSDFISATYSARAKVFKLSAYINMGLYSRLRLKDTIIWKGRKYLINNMSTNFKTGKTDLELVTRL